MSKKKATPANAHAFPISRGTRNTKYNNPETGAVEIASEHEVEGGLTKREYIATRLLAAFSAQLNQFKTTADAGAINAAIRLADALIAELNKK